MAKDLQRNVQVDSKETQKLETLKEQKNCEQKQRLYERMRLEEQREQRKLEEHSSGLKTETMQQRPKEQQSV